MVLFDLRPKNKRIANQIRIDTPQNFRRSVRDLQVGGLSLHEYQALVLAQNRARAMLNRGRLSVGERAQMAEISVVRLPRPSGRKYRQ